MRELQKRSGLGVPPRSRFFQQIGDDAFPVGALQRDHRQRNAELAGDRAGVTKILLPGTLAEVFQFVFEPDLEIEGVQVVTCLYEPRERDGAVHSSGNKDGNTHGNFSGEWLTACGQSHAAFGQRCIPAEPRRLASLIVAFRSQYTRYSSLTRLVSRAPRRPRRSRHFIHRLLTACGKTHAAFGRRCIPPEPLRFAPFFVAFRSKDTRYSSLTRLVGRAPHRPRRSREFHHRLLTPGPERTAGLGDLES